MAGTDPTPHRGEPQRAAWTSVRDALEDALDTPELPAGDRGLLANWHDAVSNYLGDPPVVVPLESPALGEPVLDVGDAIAASQRRLGSLFGELRDVVDARRALLESFQREQRRPSGARPMGRIDQQRSIINGPDGIGGLDLDTATFAALRAAGLIRIAELEARDREGTLMAVDRIGPNRVAAIRRALERFHGGATSGPTA